MLPLLSVGKKVVNNRYILTQYPQYLPGLQHKTTKEKYANMLLSIISAV